MAAYKRWVFISLTNFKIEDIQVFTIVPTAPNDYRWISQDNWAEPEVIPEVGMLWNQDPLLAIFTAPNADETPATQTEALDSADAALDKAKNAIAEARALLG